MFQITEDPLSGSLLQCLAKIKKMVLSYPLTWSWSVLWQHILTRFVCVCVCVCVVHCIGMHCSAFIYSELHTRTTSCNFSQALYKAPL